MKKFMMLLCIFAFNANANLITLATENTHYNTDDTVLLDIVVDQVHEDMATLEVDIAFDNTTLAFNDFMFDDIIITPAFPAFGALFTDIMLKGDNVLSIAVWWFDAIDVPSISFHLGRAEFTALTELTTNFNVIAVKQFDINETELVTSVNEPTTGLLMIIAMMALCRRRLANH